jgi:alpha-L-fucosidase
VGFGNTDWFTSDRFGMFIHWGLYALPARHEWVKKREQITTEDYQKYFDHFEPDLYDPVQWAADAKAAGMKYAVLTSKHHEGFCLWDSQLTDYKVTNTPIGRDLLKERVLLLGDRLASPGVLGGRHPSPERGPGVPRTGEGP